MLLLIFFVDSFTFLKNCVLNLHRMPFQEMAFEFIGQSSTSDVSSTQKPDPNRGFFTGPNPTQTRKNANMPENPADFTFTKLPIFFAFFGIKFLIIMHGV